MSEYFLRIIPTDPCFAPNSAAQQQTLVVLASMLDADIPTAVELNASVTFVDQGERFTRLSCPKCGKELEMDWWQTVMDAAYARNFSNLMTQTPCCHNNVSLNDLVYEAPAGFARFVIELDLGERSMMLDEAQLYDLSQILGVELKQVLAEY